MKNNPPLSLSDWKNEDGYFVKVSNVYLYRNPVDEDNKGVLVDRKLEAKLWGILDIYLPQPGVARVHRDLASSARELVLEVSRKWDPIFATQLEQLFFAPKVSGDFTRLKASDFMGGKEELDDCWTATSPPELIYSKKANVVFKLPLKHINDSVNTYAAYWCWEY